MIKITPMNFKKETKYLKDVRPSVICLKSLNSRVYWNELSWYCKKRIINEYLASQNLKLVDDLRNIRFKNIHYDFHTRKIISLEIN